MSITTEFSVDQYKLAYPDGIENHWWHLARNAIVFHEIKKISTLDSVVLDVGCGRGIAVKSFRNQGIECRGVELADTTALQDIEPYIQFGVNATQLPLHERQEIDIILLLDVIEHIPEPTTYLHHLVDAFANLKYLILTLPSRRELWSNYDEFYGHFRRYTPEMVHDMAGEIQWEVVRQSYFFRPLYPPMRLLNYLKINRNTKIKPSNGLSGWLHNTLSTLMILDHYLLPAKIPGTSLIACLRHL